jgi:hypothetical protein
MTKREKFKKLEQLEGQPNERSAPPIETFEKLHEKPVDKMTRRELIASGLIPMVGTIAAPSILSMLAPHSAQAQELQCKVAGSTDWCPFMSFNMAGGYASSANFLPTGKDGGLLPVNQDGSGGYSMLGMGSRPDIATEFKADSTNQQTLFYADSQLLAGVRLELLRIAGLAALSAPSKLAVENVLKNTSFIGVCMRAQDDSATNKVNISGLVQLGGLSGKLVNGLGQSNTLVGTSELAAITQPAAALVVNNQSSIEGALGFDGVLASLSAPQQTNMMRTISSISGAQALRYINNTGGSILQQLMGCANKDNTNLVSNQGNLDISPLMNADVALAWMINANTNRGDSNFVRASIAYNVILGNASTGGITEGGNDYHNGSRTSGDAKDMANGITLARLLATAAILNKKLFTHMTTDGAVRSPISAIAGGPWASDNGAASVQYVVAYDPSGKSHSSGTQISYFNPSQAAADDFGPFGTAQERASAAVYVNYLSFNNQLGIIEQVLPRLFNSVEIDQVLKLYA